MRGVIKKMEQSDMMASSKGSSSLYRQGDLPEKMKICGQIIPGEEQQV